LFGPAAMLYRRLRRGLRGALIIRHDPSDSPFQASTLRRSFPSGNPATPKLRHITQIMKSRPSMSLHRHEQMVAEVADQLHVLAPLDEPPCAVDLGEPVAI